METQEKFFWGAILGSAIGVAAALILTPLSGERMRRKIIKGLHLAEQDMKRKSRVISSTRTRGAHHTGHRTDHRANHQAEHRTEHHAAEKPAAAHVTRRVSTKATHRKPAHADMKAHNRKG